MTNAPQPKITDINRPFWDGCRTGKLMLQRCTRADCRKFVFYPRVCCPYCGCGELGWEQASGEGRLQSWTVVHRTGHAAFQPEAPYLFAAVTLAEGPVIYARVAVLPDAPSLAIDMPVRVVFPDVTNGAVLPAFVPAGY